MWEILHSVLKLLSPQAIIALFSGFLLGIAVSGLVYDEVDEMFYKDRSEELVKHYDNLKARITSCETEMAETRAKNAELEVEVKTQQSSDNIREQFMQFLSTYPSRPCDTEFVSYNLKFNSEPIEDWEVEEGSASARSIKLYNDAYDDGYIILNPGKPSIRIHNHTYTSILLERSKQKCSITFSLPKQ